MTLPDANPKTKAAATKAPLHLVPPSLLASLAPVFRLGAEKYGAYNWREPGQGVSASTYYSACLRHLAKWFDGEDLDRESHLPHIDHAAACLAILIDARDGLNPYNDDRPYPGPCPDLLGDSRAVVAAVQEKGPALE